MKSDIGLNEVEDYNSELNLKLKSKALRDRGPLSNRGVVRQAMRQKLQDEVRVRDECTRERDKIRRQVKSIYGSKSTTTKAILKTLKTDSDKIRVELRQKYMSKIAHLKRKFEKRKAEAKAKKPVQMSGFEGAKVFTSEFNDISIDDITVSQVGSVILPEKEKAVLRLHPKFAVRDMIDDEEIEFQEELGWAKLRFKLLKEEEERLDSDDDEDDLTMTEDDLEDDQKFVEMEEIIEAKSRQFFDPEEKIFNYGKKRATDLKENSRVTLPKPCNTEDEAGIEIRRKSMKTTLKNFKMEHCNSKNEQKPNLSKEERDGLKSLQRRLKDGEIIFLRTDKSSKLAVTDMETYLEMGKKHTKNDRIVDMEEVREREKVVNGHTAMMIKITGMGSVWGHGPRMRSSKMTTSKNTASLFLLLKDHKAVLDSRGVVSACNSNTVGLSNIMSEIIESVANAVKNPTEVISSEDMLARIAQCNKELQCKREANGGYLSPEDEKLYLIGADVIALFPNMTSARTGKVVRDEVISSPVEFENLNCREMARYAVVCEKMTSGVEEVRRLLPRRSKEGAKVESITMKNKEIQGMEADTEIEWTFPTATPTNAERRILFGITCEI